MVYQKQLIDEVSGWLRVYDDNSVDRTWSGQPEVKFVTDPIPPHEHVINGVATRDVTIDSISGNRVRIYLPEIKSEIENIKIPIVVHFHGGGFCISQADWNMYYQFYSKLCCTSQCVVVSVFLRLAPEHRLPAACDDGFSALLWLRSLARGEACEPWVEEFGDFNRIFLIGDSSGGNIVHSVASKAGNEDVTPIKLAGAIPIHPGFVRSTRSKSETEQPESPFLTLEMVDKFLNLSLPIGSNKDHPITCPMGELAPAIKDLKLPPVLLCLAEKDLIWDTEMEYLEAMREAEKEIEVFVSEGMGHSFYLNLIAVDLDESTTAETRRLHAGIAEFIKKH